MTDFRALCAELTEFVARLTKHYYQPAELLTRARAALANEPAVSNPPGPTDQDLLRLYKVATPCYKVEEYKRELDFARAVLARWGTPNSAETRRSLGEPAAGEVAELVAWLRGANWDRQRQTPATRAADLLERLSPPQPVPVSERLPGPEGPSIEDVEELCKGHFFNVVGYESHERLQGLINEAIARWGNPAPLADTHYEWELEDAEGEWQAGGSSNSQSDVEREGMRYLHTYTQDGPHKLIIRQHTTQTINEITDG